MAESNSVQDIKSSSNDDREEEEEKCDEKKDNEKEEKSLCKVHPTEELCRYCRECRKTLCLKCLSDGHNEPEHLVQTFEEVDPWARQQLREHIEQMQAQQAALVAYGEQLKLRQIENERLRQEECAQVDRNVEAVCAMVKEARDEAVGRFYVKLLQETLERGEPREPREPDLD